MHNTERYVAIGNPADRPACLQTYSGDPARGDIGYEPKNPVHGNSLRPGTECRLGDLNTSAWHGKDICRSFWGLPPLDLRCRHAPANAPQAPFAEIQRSQDFKCAPRMP